MNRFPYSGITISALNLVLLAGCTKRDLIQGHEIQGMKIKLFHENRISDPEYLIMEIDGSVVFKCRGGTLGRVSVRENRIVLASDCNYGYEYDRLQKSNFKGTEIEYVGLKEEPDKR